MDKSDFAVTITAMLEAYGQEATKARLLGYWLGLQDLDLETLQRAVSGAVRACKALPTPAALRELAGEASAEGQAIQAWGDVLRAIRLGPYKHIDFEDRRCNAAIRMLGGWPTFLDRFRDSESEKWARLDFLKAYRSMSSEGHVGDAGKPLPGIAQVCVRGGRKVEPVPVRIKSSVPRVGISERKSSQQLLR